MGGAQSRPASPLPSPRSSPHRGVQEHHEGVIDGDSARGSRPRFSSRLSSFGRPSLRKRRTDSKRHATEHAKSRNGDGEADHRRSDSDEFPSSPSLGAESYADDADTGEKRQRRGEQVMRTATPTPSLATSPGPPVLALPVTQRAPAVSGAGDDSYFPSYPAPSAIEQLVAESSAIATGPRAAAAAATVVPQALPEQPIASAPPRTRTLPRPAHTRGVSLPGMSSNPGDRTMTGRLTALLGFSAPGGDDPTPAPSAPRASSLPISPQATDLGTQPFAGPSLSHPPARATDLGDEDEARIEELRAELDRARREVEARRAELESIQREATEAEARAQAQPQMPARVPVGAMLVIQGLAQTESQPTEELGDEGRSGGASGPSTPGVEGVPGSPSASGVPRRPRNLRRMSDGSLFRRRREQERERGASLDQQARMIGGLLTVAAAATANSLMQQHEAPAPPARTGVGGAIDALLNRLRPNRSARHGIEQALGSYLRNVVRDNRRTSGHARLTLPPMTTPGGSQSASMQPEFEQFLESLQGDLIGAVRSFASFRGDDDESSVGTGSTATAAPEPSTPLSPLAAMPPLEPIHSDESGERRAGVEADGEDETRGRAGNGHVHVIPTFHRQLGQTMQQEPDRFGVTGGEGQPRSLNFFRAHLFPPVPQPGDEGAAANEDDPNAIVPCIFVGVRSIQHDPAMTTEELVHHPGFPFTDGNMPVTPSGTPGAAASLPTSPMSPNSATSPASPTSPGGESYFDYSPSTPFSAFPPFSPGEQESATATADATRASSPLPLPPQTPPADSSRPPLPRVASGPARSFRDRVLSRLSRRTQPERPMNTYLVYVIGGNYPRNHPVLRIPALLTGGALSDEELQLVSELLGPARPPTATKDDIARANLRVVDGAEMRALGQRGEVLDNCTERCLICLGDFEEGEECRVLACRHGFHRECVDQWLEKGANSCPACRTAAVDRKQAGAAGSADGGASGASVDAEEEGEQEDANTAIAAGLVNPLVPPSGPLSLAPERAGGGAGAGPSERGRNDNALD